MDLTALETDLLDAYLAPFRTLAGDRRTRALLAATIPGIIASESLICAQIATFFPCTGRWPAERETTAPDAAR